MEKNQCERNHLFIDLGCRCDESSVGDQAIGQVTAAFGSTAKHDSIWDQQWLLKKTIKSLSCSMWEGGMLEQPICERKGRQRFFYGA